MKKFLFTFLATTAPILYLQAHNSASHTHAPTIPLTYIEASELKNWMDSGKQFVLLDARTREYDDGRRLPGAIWMPFNSDEQNLADAIGKKGNTVVVYCWSHECPASGWLAERLIKKGYTNVFEFAGGLEEWADAGYPVTNIK